MSFVAGARLDPHEIVVLVGLTTGTRRATLARTTIVDREEFDC
jgi:hypothetical protein